MTGISFVLAFALAGLANYPAHPAAMRENGTAGDFAGRGDVPWSVRMTDAVLSRLPNYLTYDSTMSWNYEEGVLLHAIWKVWKKTGDRKYFDYVKKSIDYYVTEDGTIKSYNQSEYRLDDITPGRVVLDLYAATKERRYKLAAQILRKQLKEQPRIKEGGFWHKKIYPDQMWLDGLYMAEPFYTKYAEMFKEPADYDDIARQFILTADHARDPRTGLFYHAWDESRTQKWADPKTGDSPTFWGRAMGWYMMGLVDVLDYFPKDNPNREKLVSIFRGLASALLKYQDKQTKLWYQVVDKAGAKGNYLESSASAMFAYAFAKGFNKGYLSKKYLGAAGAAFEGLVEHSIIVGPRGNPTLTNTCAGAGLGGKPYRDGSYEYYVSVPRDDNDFKGVGPFILGALEIEKAEKTKVVCLDCYHNNEWKKNAEGREVRYHYIWEDTANSGYSELGSVIANLGARISESRVSPTKSVLDKASIYIIVDPDTPQETKDPHYITDPEIESIVSWVRNGGVLAVFANDSGNCEFTHLNRLAERFGIQFKEDSRNDVVGKDFEVGAFSNLPKTAMFEGVRKIYLKEISTLKIKSPAKSNLTDNGDVIMASAHYGKGFVFAVGDPWFYNEYIDNRKLPASFDNLDAARSLFEWLLSKASPVTAE